jgi:hypothetical protein
VVRAEAEHLVPGHAYLVGAGAAAATVSHSELRTAFRAIADDLRAAAEAGP